MSFNELPPDPPELKFVVPPDATASPVTVANTKATLADFLERLHETSKHHGGYPQNFSGTVLPRAFRHYTIINIGSPSNNPYLGPNAHKFEADALRILAGLYCLPLGQRSWGHISSGSTTALLSAVVKANKELRGPARPVLNSKNTIILANEEVHYATPKNAGTTHSFFVSVPVKEDDVEEGKPRTCKGIDLEALAVEVLKYRDHPLILVASCGTTFRELRDDVVGMIEVVRAAGIREDQFRLIIDGANAGPASNMLPEVPERERAKFHRLVFAIVCSLHKAIGSNRVGGVVIGRVSEGAPTGDQIDYLNGACDAGVEGSRNGAMAVALWIRLLLYGWEGYS